MNKSSIEDALDRSRHPSARERRSALLELCPCEVRANVPAVWDRLVEMQNDPDVRLRRRARRRMAEYRRTGRINQE
jgi:hypothetical protein